MTIDLKPTLVVREAHVFEGPGQGNGNHRPEAGETVSMNVDLMAKFADATGITALVTSDDPMITVHSSTIHYPETERFHRAEPVDPVIFTIDPDTPLNYEARFQIVISCDQEDDRIETFHAVVTIPRVLYWKDCRYAGKTNFQDQPLLDALDNAGIAYDMFVTTAKEHVDKTEQLRYPWEEFDFLTLPTYEQLRQYEAIIWYIGEKGHTSRREYAETIFPEIVKYLDNGGNIMITSHEIMFNLARPEWGGEDRIAWIDSTATPNPDDFDEYNHWFIYNYLQIAGIDHDNHYAEVMGSPSDPLTRGIHQNLDKMVYNTGFATGYYWWPDNLVPRENAIPMMYAGPPVRPEDRWPESQEFFDDHYPYEMAERTSAVRYQGDNFRTIFAAYPIEAAGNPGLFLIPAVNWLLDGHEDASEILVNVDTNYRWAKYNSTAEPPRGDPFELYGYVYNPGSTVQAQRWVLMQIFDMFWAWPSWIELDQGFDFMDVTIPSGHSRDQFLAFEWPNVDGEFDGILFWFAHLNNQGQLLGTFDYCVFGYY